MAERRLLRTIPESLKSFTERGFGHGPYPRSLMTAGRAVSSPEAASWG